MLAGSAFVRLLPPRAILLTVCVLGAGLAPPARALQAGVGRADITPPKGTPLGGYSARNGKPSAGVHDRIYAKALALSDGKQRVVIVTTDLIASSPYIKQEVVRKTGIPSDRLLLCASHTHSGPGAFAQGLFPSLVLGSYDERVYRLLRDRISQAVLQATRTMVPARLGWGSVVLPGVTRNRRGGTLTDPRLSALRVDGPGGKTLAALVHLTAHGTVLDADNMQVSGDWMGALQRHLERSLSTTVLYANGAEGDQSPVVGNGKDRFAEADAYGRKVAAAAARLLRSLRPRADVAVSARSSQFPLPDGPGRGLLGLGPSVQLQVVRLGGVLLAAVPGEPIVELGERMKSAARSAGAALPLVVGLANDHVGYLLTRAEYEKGGYERRVSFFGPDFGDDLAAALGELIAGKTAPLPAGSQGLSAGAARAVITPQRPVYLAGYEGNRLSQGVHDDLFARCLYLRSGKEAVALVGLDLMGLSRRHVNEIRQRVTSLPAERIIIASTHTHSGPDTYGQWGPTPTQSGVDPEYVRWMQDQVVKVIQDAVRSARPARLKLAAVRGIEQASENARIPAILDTELGALQAVGTDGEPIATLVNYACHPEVMHTRQVSADFPGHLYRRLEERGGGMGLFLNGALGGMVTGVILHPDAGGDHTPDARRIGELLADKALEALSSARPAQDTTIELQRSVFRVPLENQRFEALIQAGVLPDMRENGAVVTEVSRVRLGPAEMVTIPGEATPDIGLMLKRLMSGAPRFVVGLACDELGYILPEESYGLPLFEYETSVSVGSQIGPLVKENLRKLTSSQPIRTAAPSSVNADAWFAALPQRLKPNPSLNATFQVRLTGDQPGTWWLAANQGRVTTGRGAADSPQVTLEASSTDFFDIIAGKLDPLAALLTGRAKVTGDLDLVKKLSDLLDSRR